MLRWIVFFVVLLSRLPFLDAGYGVDPDAFRVAAVAVRISEGGSYSASRLPGFPLHEILCSAIPHPSPLALNFLSSLASALAAMFLFQLLERFGRSRALIATAAFACTPAVYIASVSTIDYLFAVAAILAALLALLQNRPTMAGVLLGLAIGFRITSGLFVIPLGLLHDRRSETRRGSVIRLLGGAVLVGGLAFIPVIRTYGWSFLNVVPPAYPSYQTIIKSLTLDLWGTLGTVAVIALMTLLFVRSRNAQLDASGRALDVLSQYFIGMQIALFLLLPLEAGYLIPGIPFLLMLAVARSSVSELALASSLIILSGFCIGIEPTDRPWSPEPTPLAIEFHAGGRAVAVEPLRGGIVQDRARRSQRTEFVRRVIRFAGNQQDAVAIVCGVWQPEIGMTAERGFLDVNRVESRVNIGKATCIGLLSGREIDSLTARRIPIIVMPGQAEYNRSVYGVDPREAGARELSLGHEREKKSRP